jgi:hypothetical protein
MNRSATDYPRAIADFTQAVEINPNEPVWKHHAPCFNTSGRPQFPEVVAGRGGPSAQCRNAIGTGGLPTSARRFLSRGTALPFESWPAKGVR